MESTTRRAALRWALGFLGFVAVGVLKQNRERRRIRLFLYVAGRKARYERDAQARIRSLSNALSLSLSPSDARIPLSHRARL